MPRCEQCGNDQSWTFTIEIDGHTHIFDSFECAIFAVAPACSHCGCRILGHPLLQDTVLFCCAHCAGHHREAISADPHGV